LPVRGRGEECASAILSEVLESTQKEGHIKGGVGLGANAVKKIESLVFRKNRRN